MGVLLKNGEVLDPGAGLAGTLDVRVRDGLVREVAAALAPDGDAVIDVAGSLVVPGLIDLRWAARGHSARSRPARWPTSRS